MDRQQFQERFSAQLSNLIEEREYSLRALAEETGLSRETVRRWAVGESLPDAYHLHLLSQSLGGSVFRMFLDI